MSDPDPPEIVLQNPNRYPEAAARRLRPWLAALLADLVAAEAAGRPAPASFGVRFVGDRASRAMNRDYRGKDRPTDVLSFPGDWGAARRPSAEPSPEGPHLGDVAVSVPAARRQAAEQGVPVERELRRLVLHGVLHCLGYDHESDGGAMERLERRLARRWLE